MHFDMTDNTYFIDVFNSENTKIHSINYTNSHNTIVLARRYVTNNIHTKILEVTGIPEYCYSSTILGRLSNTVDTLITRHMYTLISYKNIKHLIIDGPIQNTQFRWINTCYNLETLEFKYIDATVFKNSHIITLVNLVIRYCPKLQKIISPIFNNILSPHTIVILKTLDRNSVNVSITDDVLNIISQKDLKNAQYNTDSE